MTDHISNFPPLRCAVVGLTGIGAGRPTRDPDWPLHAPMPDSHVAAYVAHPRTRVVALCDLNLELMKQVQATWDSELPDARTYQDYRELLEREELDVLSVVTSDNRHADIVVDAAPRVRGIICEKPIATTLPDADRMIAAVERHQIPMSIEHTRRWSPVYHQVRARMRSGAIGRLLRVVAHLGGSRAMLFRNATHLIDMVNFLVEADPAWVFAELDDGFEDYFAYRGDGGRSPEGDPGGSGYVHYVGGVRAFFNCSKGTCKTFEIELIGSEGEIRVGDETAILHTRTGEGRLAGHALSYPDFQMVRIMGAIDEMVRLVEHGGQSVSPPRDGRKALEIILGFLESQRRGGARVDLPLNPRT